MKEDKLDMEIAASLKKKLEEASVPYEVGAWEGFQKKRALRNRRMITYWASGIAASLLLIAVGLNSIDVVENDNSDPTELKLADNSVNIPETSRDEPATSKTEEEILKEEKVSDHESIQVKPSANPSKKPSEASKAPEKQMGSNSVAIDSKPVQKIEQSEKVNAIPQLPSKEIEKEVAQVESVPNNGQELAKKPKEGEKIREVEKPFLGKENSTAALAMTESGEKTPPVENEKVVEKEKFVAESEFPVIEKDKTTVGLGMGVSPGFGAIQSDNQVATASSIGLGMLVDLQLPGKLTLGSGLALNYLNQSTKQEGTTLAFGNIYPQSEKVEVRQMQVEIPVFVKYPVTRNNSVSIQAGFSNYYALNETASQENTVQLQSAFYANDALGNSSVSFRQEAVVENNSLESKSGKFYPFATLNFGVNLRVLETKGANYVIMPFYNYQLTQVSGYGDTYGLFGASFKMNFGGGEK
ncbi:hypothetical protein [uncultured Algoriphagus sp.]|uniref:hypothetical protein n=1 Tax=uncultured Algoriphagus sp. TaxID=417365 RepID=UPI0030ECDBA9|tara:strand:+ start:32517 stop:33923 length:1407 start_codon:yes stop_codon:yes gene_type:complete